MSSEFGVSCSENSEKSSEKVIGGWVDLEGYRGVRRYPVWYISGIEQVQKRGQDTGIKKGVGREISDTGQTQVDGWWNSLVDVCLRGEIVWITFGVDVLRCLVHPHVVDGHDRREGQVFKIDRSEVG